MHNYYIKPLIGLFIFSFCTLCSAVEFIKLQVNENTVYINIEQITSITITGKYVIVMTNNQIQYTSKFSTKEDAIKVLTQFNKQ